MQKPRVPFVSEKLQQIFNESFTNEIAELVHNTAPYLNSNDAIEFQHGRHWASPANELGDKSGEVERHSAECSIAPADIVKGDPKIIFKHINEVAIEMISSFDRMFFDKIDEVTSRTGNVVNPADHNSLLEAFFAMIEKTEMSVDENGNLNLPTIIVPADYNKELKKAKQEASPEMHKRMEQILVEKLAEATQKEAERIGRFEIRES